MAMIDMDAIKDMDIKTDTIKDMDMIKDLISSKEDENDLSDDSRKDGETEVVGIYDRITHCNFNCNKES